MKALFILLQPYWNRIFYWFSYVICLVGITSLYLEAVNIWSVHRISDKYQRIRRCLFVNMNAVLVGV